MFNKIKHSPYYYLNSRQLNLSDFGLKINNKRPEEKVFSIAKNENMLLNFVKLTYNYAKWIFPKYSCDYSNYFIQSTIIIHYFSNENLFENNLS